MTLQWLLRCRLRGPPWWRTYATLLGVCSPSPCFRHLRGAVNGSSTRPRVQSLRLLWAARRRGNGSASSSLPARRSSADHDRPDCQRARWHGARRTMPRRRLARVCSADGNKPPRDRAYATSTTWPRMGINDAEYDRSPDRWPRTWDGRIRNVEYFRR